MGSVTHTYSWLLWALLINTRFVSSHTLLLLYIIEQLSVGSTAANDSILAPFSKQTESFHSPCGIGCLRASHQWLGLAISSLACPDLAADHRPNSKTYKSHRYASRVKQYKAQSYGKLTHTQLFYILMLNMSTINNYKYTPTASLNFTLTSWESLLGPKFSVGHNKCDSINVIWCSQQTKKLSWEVPKLEALLQLCSGPITKAVCCYTTSCKSFALITLVLQVHPSIKYLCWFYRKKVTLIPVQNQLFPCLLINYYRVEAKDRYRSASQLLQNKVEIWRFKRCWD